MTPNNGVTLVDIHYQEITHAMLVSRNSVVYPEISAGMSHESSLASNDEYRERYQNADSITNMLFIYMMMAYARDPVISKYFVGEQIDLQSEDEFLNDVANNLGITDDFVKQTIDSVCVNSSPELYKGAKLYATITQFGAKYNYDVIKQLEEWIDTTIKSAGIVGGNAVDEALKS